MGRRGRPPKNIVASVATIVSNVPPVNIGDELICPVCGKKFKVVEDTKYLIGKEYSCSWNCFITNSRSKKRHQEDNND